MQRQFQRIAIINRGEPAMRLIHAVREYNLEHGTALRTIALYTEPDRGALFVREADEDFYIGPALAPDPETGRLRSRYVDYAVLREALRRTRAEAAWVGWGFVAEDADFADLCTELGVVFIGPSGAVIRRLGDKITAKQLAEQARVPVAPWSGRAVSTVEEAVHAADRIGYPLMVKATAGGGGRGIRRVTDRSALGAAFTSARAEAEKAFGDGTIFVERMVRAARHIEVQLIADSGHTAWAVGVRDCSAQRKNQKIIEESGSTVLDPNQERTLKEAAVRLAGVVGYENAGTVEFLYDPADRNFSFMEVNARLQVEHPVTELVTGVDLVKLQLHVARGGRLGPNPPSARGHAIEVRLCAEDPDNAFMPSAGRIEELRIPHGPGVRVDSGYETGDAVPSDFDSMVAKVLAWGTTREEARARLVRTLSRTAIAIHGGTTNKAFLLRLLQDATFARGEHDIGWVDRLVSAGPTHARSHAGIAVLQAAIAAYERELSEQMTRFYDAAARGRPQLGETAGSRVELAYEGQTFEIDVHRTAPDRYRFVFDGHRISIRQEVLAGRERRLTCGSARYRVVTQFQGQSYLVDVDGEHHRIGADSGRVVRAPAPSVVTRVEVAEGQKVGEGDRLVVLEAMKTETSLAAPFGGIVQRIQVVPNTQIAAGAAILAIEPDEAGASERTSTVDFSRLCAGAPSTLEPHSRILENLEDLRLMLLGYDVDATTADQLGETHEELSADLPRSPRVTAKEDEVLRVFVDLATLFRTTPDDGERIAPEQYFFDYLAKVDHEGEGLPATFLEGLRRALHHYGVSDFTLTRRLKEALFRMAKAQRRPEAQLAAVASVLAERLIGIEVEKSSEHEPFRSLIERVIRETRDRFESIHDIAYQVRYRQFLQPDFEKTRHEAYAQAETLFADPESLSAERSPRRRAEVVDALARSPVSLRAYLSQRYAHARPETQALMLEVLTRSYYLDRPIHRLSIQSVARLRFACAHYLRQGVPVRAITTHVEARRLKEALLRAGQLAADVPLNEDIVIDIYLWREGVPANLQETEEEVRQAIRTARFSRPIRRIIASVSSLALEVGKGDGEHFTFRPDAHGIMQEDRACRGVHPLMAERLDLWRLQDFDTERLPSIEDVYLFKAAARSNPSDTRLIALAEVQAIAPERDAMGRVKRLPHFERVLMEAFASIRWFQARRSSRSRLHWNRVVINVRPTLSIQPRALTDLIRRLVPEAEGLGLEKVQVKAIFQNRHGEGRVRVLDISNPSRHASTIRLRFPPTTPLETLTPYTQSVVRLRERGLVQPYELIKMLAPFGESLAEGRPGGEFEEYDLDEGGRLVPVAREPGQNTANLVVGLVRNFTRKYPEGMERVIIASDPGRNMGALSEAECVRIMQALDLAEARSLPVEWFACSGGARISMNSGTENMDWVAAALRRIVQFTEAGGTVHVIVTGVNVGAQPYWNAEATMLMHTRGILIMTAAGSMVLTGKRALDFSGGVSAEDNAGIGGYARIMGPNGQAQYFATDVAEAQRILLRYYDHSYVRPPERFPRSAVTEDPADRDVRSSPHDPTTSEFASIGDVFSAKANPAKKKPFRVRRVMQAVIDQDNEPLERWFAMRDAEGVVVWDVHLGGHPLCLIGIESEPIQRHGIVPADGPAAWTAGTLFPRSSKKLARALNSASGNRPAVVLANLSGFDGSPESMRNLQLEYGAEIGRAVVNFRGPIVFLVISRYHGGAFVVFSHQLNRNLEVAALEDTYASVIGGAPAAAVVFARDVDRRAREDPRLKQVEQELARIQPGSNPGLLAHYRELLSRVRNEKLGQVAEEFDRCHSVERARKVGSIHEIVPPARLRPYLIDAVERGMKVTDRPSTFLG